MDYLTHKEIEKIMCPSFLTRIEGLSLSYGGFHARYRRQTEALGARRRQQEKVKEARSGVAEALSRDLA